MIKNYLWVADPRQVTFLCVSKEEYLARGARTASKYAGKARSTKNVDRRVTAKTA
jgi:hypothetical protein